MTWLATALISVIAVEIALRLPFAALGQRAQATAARALATMRRPRVSDHWKEKAMLALAGRMMGCSLRLAGAIAALFGAVGLIAFGVDAALPGYLVFLTGLGGLAGTLVFATLWALVRRRLV